VERSGIPRRRPPDRALLAGLARCRPPARLGHLLVRPDTLLRCHSDLVRRRWTQPSRPPGRPPLPAGNVAMILRPTRENATWGHPGAALLHDGGADLSSRRETPDEGFVQSGLGPGDAFGYPACVTGARSSVRFASNATAPLSDTLLFRDHDWPHPAVDWPGHRHRHPLDHRGDPAHRRSRALDPRCCRALGPWPPSLLVVPLAVVQQTTGVMSRRQRPMALPAKQPERAVAVHEQHDRRVAALDGSWTGGGVPIGSTNPVKPRGGSGRSYVPQSDGARLTERLVATRKVMAPRVLATA
jgi:hypothetical protein